VVSLVAAAVVAALAAGGTVVTTVLSRKPGVDRADYADRLVGASVGLVQELQEEMGRVKAELADEKVRASHCEQRFDFLVTNLRTQGIDIPPFVPPS
jgi:ABC-type amino acid transport substrate-binding protein